MTERSDYNEFFSVVAKRSSGSVRTILNWRLWMRSILRHVAWKPAVDETSEGGIMPLYEVSRNYKKVDIVIDTVWYGGKRRAGGG